MKDILENKNVGTTGVHVHMYSLLFIVCLFSVTAVHI